MQESHGRRGRYTPSAVFHLSFEPLLSPSLSLSLSPSPITCFLVGRTHNFDGKTSKREGRRHTTHKMFFEGLRLYHQSNYFKYYPIRYQKKKGRGTQFWKVGYTRHRAGRTRHTTLTSNDTKTRQDNHFTRQDKQENHKTLQSQDSTRHNHKIRQ